MKTQILATPEFIQKVKGLDVASRADFDRVVSSLKNKNASEIADYLKIKLISSKIQYFKIGKLRVFVNFLKNKNKNDILFFVDLTLTPSHIQTNRNPNFNSQINPKFNSQINPNFNSQINPKFNSQINPNFNSQINPKFNSQINPNFNSQINPKFNSQINPNFNSQINPKFNSQINPNFNSGFTGFYSYDLNGTPLEFVVSTEDGSILLFFDFASNQTKFGVRHGVGNGYSLYDLSNNYIGHAESDSQNGFNVFSASNEWTAYLK